MMVSLLLYVNESVAGLCTADLGVMQQQCSQAIPVCQVGSTLALDDNIPCLCREADCECVLLCCKVGCPWL
jgi:hypothetical protein